MKNELVFKIVPVLILLLGLATCRLPAGPPTPLAVSSPTASVRAAAPTPSPSEPASTTSPVPPTASPVPLTPSPLPPSPTSQPTEADPTMAAELQPAPGVDVENLAPYRQAMLPDFRQDVDTVAAAGASLYHLEVSVEFDSRPDQAATLRLNGRERVRYTNTEDVPLRAIYFRLYPNLPGYGGEMIVETVMVNDQFIEPVLEAHDSALQVPLPRPLSPGAVAEISLTYQTQAPAQTELGYNIFAYTDQTAALAGFYPTIAVYDNTGWNIEIPPPYGDATYLDVSLYQVQLTIPEPMIVAASGSLLARTSQADGRQTLSLVSGPMRDFYLAMRPDFQVVSEMVAGVTVNSYYPPGREAGGKVALRYAVDALRVFNERFGPYPYVEFDIVATPTTAGGVEYPGIVVIAQNLYDESGGFFQHATAHEVAHQWWYGLVGNDQVDTPWLDESLTNYSTAIYWEAVEGPDSARRFIENAFLGPYEQAKSQGQDRAVVGPVSDFSAAEYGTFVYGKGPLFFHALRQEVGDETYFKIMQTYYAEYKYKIAQPADLMEIIERISGRNVEPLFEMWLQN